MYWLRVMSALALTLLALSTTGLSSASTVFLELLWQSVDDQVDSYTHVMAYGRIYYVIGSRGGYLVVSKIDRASPDVIERLVFERVAGRSLYILDSVLEADAIRVLAAVDEGGSAVLYFITVSLAAPRVSVDSTISLPRGITIVYGSIWGGSSLVVAVSGDALVASKISPREVEWTIQLPDATLFKPSACIALRRDGVAVVAFSASHGLSVALVSPAGSLLRILNYNTSTPIIPYDCSCLDLALLVAGSIVVGESYHPILIYMTTEEPVKAGHSIGDTRGAFSALVADSGRVYATAVTEQGVLIARYSFSLEAGFRLEKVANLTQVANREVIALALARLDSTIAVAGAIANDKSAYLALLREVEELKLTEFIAPALIATSLIALAILVAAVAITVFRKRRRMRSQMD
ncbi:MAG: hypothetical protein QXS85_01170 [Acidilobaceae archaeon]